MKLAVSILIMLIHLTSFSQIKVVESEKPTTIGKVTMGPYLISEIQEFSDGRVLWTYQDVKFKQTQEFKYIKFSNKNNELKDLYELIRVNMVRPPEDNIEVFLNDDNKLMLSFKKGKVTIAHINIPTEIMGFMMELNVKRVNKLFGYN